MSRKGGDEAGKEEENKPLQWQALQPHAHQPLDDLDSGHTLPSHFWISHLIFGQLNRHLKKEEKLFTRTLLPFINHIPTSNFVLVGTVFVWRKEEKDCYHASDKHRKTARCDRRASPHQRSTVTSMPARRLCTTWTCCQCIQAVGE